MQLVDVLKHGVELLPFRSIVHTKPTLHFDLHWLPVASRIKYKLFVNADSLPPKYIDDWNVINGNTIILIMSSLF